MQDAHAIADKLEALAEYSEFPESYRMTAEAVRRASTALVEQIMISLDFMQNDPSLDSEKKRDVSDFAFDQRSYR